MLCLGLVHFFVEVSEVLRPRKMRQFYKMTLSLVMFNCCFVAFVPFPCVSFYTWATKNKN